MIYQIHIVTLLNWNSQFIAESITILSKNSKFVNRNSTWKMKSRKKNIYDAMIIDWLWSREGARSQKLGCTIASRSSERKLEILSFFLKNRGSTCTRCSPSFRVRYLMARVNQGISVLYIKLEFWTELIRVKSKYNQIFI